MSIPKLALLVIALLAGTAASVQSYLESRRPLVLTPSVLVRDLPEIRPAPCPAPPAAGPRALPGAFELAREPRPSAAAPAAAPAMVVEASAPEPQGDVSRWITVRRDGQGRARPDVRRSRPCGAGAAVGRPAATPAAAGCAAPAGPPAAVRPD